jgi:glycerophosphoryl diester phosphodiesterase
MLPCMWLRTNAGPERPLLVAHKAGAAFAGDDPIAGVRRLVAMGTEMVEIDIRATRDGVLVVHHDAAVDGALIRDTDYPTIAALGKGRLAPLDEVFDAAGGHLAFDIELKESGYEAAVLAALRDGANTERIVVTSACDAAIAEFKRLEPDIATGLLVGSRKRLRRPLRMLQDAFPFRRMAACRADFLAPARALLLTGLARRAEERGVRLLVWTVNDPEEVARHLSDPCVLGVVTDSAELLAAFGRERGREVASDRGRADISDTTRL